MAPRSIESGIALPPAEAIAFLRQKANVTTERWTDIWNEAHSRSFVVAGATSQALVGDFRTAVAKAIETGSTLAEFRRDFDGIVEKHGWEHNGSAGWRSQIIYETNLSMAYAAGRYAQMTEADTLRVYPYWQYQHTSSAHPRPQHLAWVGTTLPADDPWWSTHYPPNGWRCRCSVRPVSAAGLRRQGKDGPDPSPKVVTETWTSKDGRRTSQVPIGIDPGFGYNPGAAWLDGTPPPTSGAPRAPLVPPVPSAPPTAVPTVPAPLPLPTPPVTPVVAPPTPPPVLPSVQPSAPVPVPPSAPDYEERLRRLEARRGVPRMPRADAPGESDFGDWSRKIITDAAKPDGTHRLAGEVSQAVRDRMQERGLVVTTPIDANAVDIRHITRSDKQAAGRGIKAPDVQRIPELLGHPLAVLADRKDPGVLIYVFRPLRQEEPRLGKLIVRLGMRSKRDGTMVTGNRVISGGLETLSNLRRVKLYELLDGTLDDPAGEEG